MVSDRIQRQIDELLDEAEQAAKVEDWATVINRAQRALAFDPENTDAQTFIAAAGRATTGTDVNAASQPADASAPTPIPTSFAGGRYAVRSLLGEGGKKLVYLAHDERLDRDVAFALIKTDGLDAAGRQRVTREAQAMGRLGDHPCLMPIHDVGEDNGSPYLVLPLMSGGDVESLLEQADEHRLSLDRAMDIAKQVARGLEFAHGQGIVHRDLKPGNVWLTNDGDVKIGDFGLAVATNRSRLTEEGMMVGTAAYMAPEQAMGSEVTPQADLYSLGAMLYEMVTGRPPFVGDDNVAIITQHLNTPPVVPTWHRPDCPPGLEALVLRLLEKDASKRPSTASEVLQALDGIDLSATPAPSAEPVQPATNPIYRRTFVGREAELKQLQDAFDGAVSGQGALAMVVGEPGIGKTSICEQLATYVAMRGGKTLVGHSYEEGSLSLPYLPFVEALRTYVLDREPDALRDELGSHASDVARIVSEVRERVQVEPRDVGDPEDDRWRLLQSVSGFLKNASNVQPLVIVLEDLHWTDRGTLDLLLHVARNLEGARLLIIGTYRDVEVDRQHPLSAALAEMRRGIPFGRITLRGLTPDEVHRMLNALTSQDVRWSLAEAIHRQTEGNPLFIQEVMRYLVEEGYISHDTGEWHRAGEEAPEAFIPEGLRDVIGKRLTRLSEECNSVLSIAAVIGRDFELPVLQHVAGLSEDELLTALEEADRAGVIEEKSTSRGGTSFRFTHAFFSQMLYQEIFSPRRIRLHQQVGRAIEGVHASNLKDHASELAEHFSQSTEEYDLSKAVLYGKLGAERAMGVFAYGEAVRLLEQAQKAQEVLNPNDVNERCELLLTFCEALMPAGQPRRVFEDVAEVAFKLAVGLEDPLPASRVCRIALMALNRYGAASTGAIEISKVWTERAVEYTTPNSIDRVYAETARAIIQGVNTGAGRQTALDSWNLALQLNDPGAAFFASRFFVTFPEAPRHRSQRMQIIERLLAFPRGGVNPRMQAGALHASGFHLLASGDKERALGLFSEVRHLGEVTQDPSVEVYRLLEDVILAFIAGELEQVIELRTGLMSRSAELGSPFLATANSEGPFVRALAYLGRLDQVAEAREIRVDSVAGGGVAGLFYDVMSGEVELTSATLKASWATVDADDASSYVASTALEAALLTGDRASANALSSHIEPGLDLAYDHYNHPVCPGRLLAEVALQSRRLDDAHVYYQKARLACERITFRPELALTRLGLAELLLDHYPDERAEAIEHLDFAINEFRDMKMQPSLERALRRKELLGA